MRWKGQIQHTERLSLEGHRFLGPPYVTKIAKAYRPSGCASPSEVDLCHPSYMPDTLLAPAAAELTEMLQNQQVEKNDEEETYGANSLLIVAENVH